jgi:hypothetical protein
MSINHKNDEEVKKRSKFNIIEEEFNKINNDK